MPIEALATGRWKFDDFFLLSYLYNKRGFGMDIGSPSGQLGLRQGQRNAVAGLGLPTIWSSQLEMRFSESA